MMKQIDNAYKDFISQIDAPINEPSYTISNNDVPICQKQRLQQMKTGRWDLYEFPNDPEHMRKTMTNETQFIHDVYFLLKIRSAAKEKQHHLIEITCYHLDPWVYDMVRYEGNLIDLAEKDLDNMTKQMASIQRQCMTAVLKVHDLGIIHRNINIFNFFYKKEKSNGNYHIVLVDFGAAIEDDGQDRPKYVQKGLDSYRAPELLCGVTTYDNKVDWYALGITFLLLTNESFLNYIEALWQKASYIQEIFGLHTFLYPFSEEILNQINPNMPPKIQKAIIKQLKTAQKQDLTLEPLIMGLCQTMAKDRWGDEEIREYLLNGTLPPLPPPPPPSSSWQRVRQMLRTFQ